MTQTKNPEILKLAKSLARTLTCSGNLATKASLEADEMLKRQQPRIYANNLCQITETTIGLGIRPQVEYVLCLAFVIARLFECMSFYKLKGPGEDIGNSRIVTFIGKGDNPGTACYLFYEVWVRLSRERRAFVSLLSGRMDRARKKRSGDDFALSQVNRLRNQVEMFIINNEITTKAIQGHIQANYGFLAESRFQPIEDTYDEPEAPKKRGVTPRAKKRQLSATW
jgi:hypothetical protein